MSTYVTRTLLHPRQPVTQDRREVMPRSPRSERELVADKQKSEFKKNNSNLLSLSIQTYTLRLLVQLATRVLLRYSFFKRLGAG